MVEEDNCSPPLAMERDSVLDIHFITVDRTNQNMRIGEGLMTTFSVEKITIMPYTSHNLLAYRIKQAIVDVILKNYSF
jgi:hypothetical protein